MGPGTHGNHSRRFPVLPVQGHAGKRLVKRGRKSRPAARTRAMIFSRAGVVNFTNQAFGALASVPPASSAEKFSEV
jgi:hypothetical protein